MSTHFIKLKEPSPSLVDSFNRWENDPELIPLTRPNQNPSDLERRSQMSQDDLQASLAHHNTYLIYLNEQLVGSMNYMVDPGHLYKKEPGTAWIGITIGEAEGRGKGAGYEAIRYLEKQIKKQGLSRIELGVFEFNLPAQKLYQKLGYKEIGRIPNFTYWRDQMWQDIRMEKYTDEI
ncbi:GNAT family N-acetyltransferase [Halobacillus sp. K22]|uniref:GNAT family N-acetyltransferase n=1 Tax=Halobacillus sp. K22 TaxID=3457431 RepID=UPI003FCC4B61